MDPCFFVPLIPAPGTSNIPPCSRPLAFCIFHNGASGTDLKYYFRLIHCYIRALPSSLLRLVSTFVTLAQTCSEGIRKNSLSVFNENRSSDYCPFSFPSMVGATTGGFTREVSPTSSAAFNAGRSFSIKKFNSLIFPAWFLHLMRYGAGTL